MKSKLINSILIFSLFTLSSCKLILLTLWGYHNPREESIVDLEKFCYSKGLDTTNLIFLKDSLSFMKYISAKDSVSKTFNIGIPEIYIFNSKGECLKYKNDSLCNASAFTFCDKICSRLNYLSNNNNRNFIEFKDYFKLSNEQQININPKDYDAIVVISWAKFVGKLNKDHVKIWEESLKKSSCKIKILKACIDPIKGMNLNFKVEKSSTKKQKK